MKTKRFFLLILTGLMAALFVGAVLSACVPATANPTTETNPFATHTAAAQMVQATQQALGVQSTQLALEGQAQAVRATQTALVILSQPTATSQPALPTATLVPAATVAPANTAVPQPTTTPLPTATKTPPPCTNLARFISENLPDDSTIQAGQFVTKIWKIENVGTCTWSTDYTIAVLNSTTLNYRTSVARNWRMPLAVKPGKQVSIPFELYAPFTGGTYEASFLLVAPSGARFGVGDKGKFPLFTRLKVADAPIPQQEAALIANLGLGAPNWDYGFTKDDGYWALKIASTSQAKFTFENGQLVMRAKETPSYRWVIGTNPPAFSQFVQATFTTGPACAGADGYGLVLRAEDVGGGRFNRAYVFQFTCDGRFRLYYMNNGTPVDTIALTASPFIKTGPDQVNRMSVLMLGSKFVLYANGEKIAEMQNTWSGNNKGFYGLMITSEQTLNLLVSVDNFKLWRLD